MDDRNEAYTSIWRALRTRPGESLHDAAKRLQLRSGSLQRRRLARLVLAIEPRDPWPGMFRAAAAARMMLH